MPLSVIEGQVVNPDGEVLAGVTVEAVRLQTRDGRRQGNVYSSQSSNDLGEYRRWRLSPGSYFVRVAGRRGTYIKTSPGTPYNGLP